MTMRLIFVDIETTGLNPVKDVPLELAITILNADDYSQIYAVDYVVWQDEVILNKLGNISYHIHGISREEIRDGYMPYQIFIAIIDAFEFMKISKNNAVFVCQNPAFDKGFFNQIFPPDYTNELGWPYHWLDLASMFWATEQMPEYMLLSKDNIAEKLGLELEEKPHRANQGVRHLIRCYRKIMKRVYEKRRNGC